MFKNRKKAFRHIKLTHLRMHLLLAVCCSSVSSRLHWVFDFRIHKREYLCDGGKC